MIELLFGWIGLLIGLVIGLVLGWWFCVWRNNPAINQWERLHPLIK